MKMRYKEPLKDHLYKCPEFWMFFGGIEIVVSISALILGGLW